MKQKYMLKSATAILRAVIQLKLCHTKGDKSQQVPNETDKQHHPLIIIYFSFMLFLWKRTQSNKENFRTKSCEHEFIQIQRPMLESDMR